MNNLRTKLENVCYNNNQIEHVLNYLDKEQQTDEELNFRERVKEIILEVDENFSENIDIILCGILLDFGPIVLYFSSNKVLEDTISIITSKKFYGRFRDIPGFHIYEDIYKEKY